MNKGVRSRKKSLMACRAIARQAGRHPEKPFPTTTSRKTLELAAARINGGREAFVEYIRMADSPECKPFIEYWDSQSIYARKKGTLDQFSQLSGVSGDKLIAAAASAAYRYNADISDMMAMSELPELVKKSVKFSKQQKGWRDREMIFKHARFLPVPQGSTISIQNSNQAVASASAQAGVASFSERISEASDDVRDAWIPPEVECTQSE